MVASDSALDIGIPTAFDRELLACSDVRIELRGALAVFFSLAHTGAGGEADRGAVAAEGRTDAGCRTHAAGIGVLAFLVLGRDKVDFVVGLELDVAIGSEIAADDVDIAVGTCPLSDLTASYLHVPPAGHRPRRRHARRSQPGSRQSKPPYAHRQRRSGLDCFY
jgi:hypothetical protein